MGLGAEQGGEVRGLDSRAIPHAPVLPCGVSQAACEEQGREHPAETESTLGSRLLARWPRMHRSFLCKTPVERARSDELSALISCGKATRNQAKGQREAEKSSDAKAGGKQGRPRR